MYILPFILHNMYRRRHIFNSENGCNLQLQHVGANKTLVQSNGDEGCECKEDCMKNARYKNQCSFSDVRL
jgi:hypothetical protein